MTIRHRQNRPTGELFYVEPRPPSSLVHKVLDKLPPLGQRLFWTQVQAEVERDYVDGVPLRQHRVTPVGHYDGSLGVGPGTAYTVTAGRPVASDARRTHKQITIALTLEEWQVLEPVIGSEHAATWARCAMLEKAQSQDELRRLLGAKTAQGLKKRRKWLVE